MSTASIPVDLFNPGQVFACLGFMELTGALIGPSDAAFDWSAPGEARFGLRVGAADPFEAALAFLAEAEVCSLVYAGSNLTTEKWGVASRSREDGSYPISPPSSPATLPAMLTAKGTSVVLSSWGEVNPLNVLGTRRDNVKFWGGAGGYPGACLLRDALDAARPHLPDARNDPFALTLPQNSSFRFDWRRDYIPIDAGFSLNNHKGRARIRASGYPLVEVLAAVGLAHARPRRVHKFEYRYGVAGRPTNERDEERALLPAPFVRAALGAAELPFPIRTFIIHLDRPDKEARCITTVQEDTAR